MKRTFWTLLVAGLPVVVGLSMIGCKAPPAVDSSVDTSAVVNGNNAFAFDLYGQLRPRDGNLFYSPYSISGALAMTSAGARGETLNEITRALHFSDQNTLHPGFKTLNAALNGAGRANRGYQLSTASALWGMKGYPFKPEFITLTRDNYGAGLQEVNFGDESVARQTINAWCEKETHDKIKDLIKPGMLDSNTRLVLTNAIYFKGDWASQFKKDHTRIETFFVAGGKQVQTPLMHQTGHFRYADLSDAQAIEMPYVGKEVSMVVLLPKRVDGLAELENDLSGERLATIADRLREVEVEVTLPKWKTTAEFSLTSELSALGMKQAFTPAADFSGLNGGQEKLYLGFVVHKAFVDVNEEGTEAAAATGVVVEMKSARNYPLFRADHPFVFVIRDTKTGGILFAGRLADPTR
jgi:serpin B